MLGTFVPFRAVFRQPFTFAISLLGSGLSFTMTLRFCQRHWPEDGGLMLVALGLLWELAKLHLAARGLAAAVHGGRSWERLGGASLVALALVLAAGSVGASVGCLVQTEKQDQKRILASSRAYASAVRDLEAIDRQIALLTETASRDLAHGFRKRAIDTTHALDSLRERRDAVSGDVQALEQQGGSPGVVSMSPDLSGRLDPAQVRLAIHVAVAAVLEIVSMVGMFLLERGLAGNACEPKRRQPRDSQGVPRSRAPSPSRVRPGRQPVDTRPYTQRLTYRFGRAEGALNQLGDSRRHHACRELMRRIGDYSLKVAWTDGLITEAQLRTLNTGTSWRATQGHLDLLLDVGALLRTTDGHYEVAYFLDENPSVATREAYAQEQRDRARSRKRRERSRCHADSTSNQHLNADENPEKSAGWAPCHAKPTTTHLDDANAATHARTHAADGRNSGTQATSGGRPVPFSPRPSGAAAETRRPVPRSAAIAACIEFEDSLPWSKYLAASDNGADGEGRGAHSAQELLMPAAIAHNPRSGARRPHMCVPARLRDDGEAINMGDVATALRDQMQDDRPEVAEAAFCELARFGVTQAQLRYANYCLKIRRQKVEIEDPLAYWLSIAKGQRAAARGLADRRQKAA